MGPCQGGFCTFRAAGLVAERGAAAASGAGVGDAPAAQAVTDGWARSDRALVDFLAERFHGTRPIAWGRQLQELWVTSGLYLGVLGIGSLVDRAGEGAADAASTPVEGASTPADAVAPARRKGGNHAPG
jgi:glycerol-3-phosphate dehydrogenase